MSIPAWTPHRRRDDTDSDGPLVIDPATGLAVDDPVLADRVRYELRVHQARDLARAIRAESQWEAIPAPLTLGEALEQAPEELTSRIERVLPANYRGVIVAPKKVGKTTVVTNVVKAVTTGGTLFGRWRCQQGRVLVLNYEVLDYQFARWCDEAEVPLDAAHVLSLRGRANPLTSTRGRTELAAQIADLGIDLLIVDPFGAASRGVVAEENSNSEVRAFLGILDELIDAAGVSELLMPAHAGRMGEHSRGASALEDWADVLWTLTTDDEHVNRFFAANGRDVDFPEAMLQFNPENRRLSFTAQHANRATAGYIAARAVALEFIAENPGCKVGDVSQALEAAAIPGASKNGAVGAWMVRLAADSEIVQVPGPRNSKLHYLPEDAPTGDPT